MFVFFHHYVLAKMFGITYFFQNAKGIFDKTVLDQSKANIWIYRLQCFTYLLLTYLKKIEEFRKDYFEILWLKWLSGNDIGLG